MLGQKPNENTFMWEQAILEERKRDLCIKVIKCCEKMEKLPWGVLKMASNGLSLGVISLERPLFYSRLISSTFPLWDGHIGRKFGPYNTKEDSLI